MRCRAVSTDVDWPASADSLWPGWSKRSRIAWMFSFWDSVVATLPRSGLSPRHIWSNWDTGRHPDLKAKATEAKNANVTLPPPICPTYHTLKWTDGPLVLHNLCHLLEQRGPCVDRESRKQLEMITQSLQLCQREIKYKMDTWSFTSTNKMYHACSRLLTTNTEAGQHNMGPWTTWTLQYRSKHINSYHNFLIRQHFVTQKQHVFPTMSSATTTICSHVF